MFSTPLVRHEIHEGRLEPSYLDLRYAELVRFLADRYEAFTGKPYRLLDAAIDAAPEASAHDSRLVAGLRRVIEEAMDLEVAAPTAPWRIREAVFEAAARLRDPSPERAYREAAAKLSLPEGVLPAHLYADLRPERVVTLSRPIPPPAEIISRYNFRLLQGLFLLADRVRVEMDEHLRAAYRLAKLHGLIVEARREGDAAPLRLEITGPLSLFHLTRKYGRALAAFLPACAVANRFRVEARIITGEKPALLVVTQADRLLSPHRPPRPFDSLLEERFFKDFIGLGSRWSVAREATMTQIGPSAFFPDFTFTLPSDPSIRVDLEIVGFWTRDYLARKQELMATLPPGRIIFCVDEKLCCDREPSPHSCIRFSRRVPAEQVLEALEGIVQ